MAISVVPDQRTSDHRAAEGGPSGRTAASQPPAAADAAPPPGSIGRAGATGLFRGRHGDPVWVRPTLLGLLGGTALLYVVGLSQSGWANSYYAAAAQAGSQNWTAFFFGSLDAGNSITVDKTPAALWVMDLSVRLFGLSSWSILVPQALIGVATVGVLYLTVRRHAGAGAGLLAGAIFALTPVAVLMFRFNNPDALLVLLLVLAAYAMTRALETTGTRWLVMAGVFLGFAFLAKMLQALLVVPGFALAYLVCARTGLPRRLGQLAAAGVALVISAGWWVAIVELWPAADRPYIGGSQTNSVLELMLGYNGLARLSGNEVGSVGGHAGWDASRLLRLFGAQIGGQVAWLLPAALVLGTAGFFLVRGQSAVAARNGLTLWAGWLVVTDLVFSLMAGISHAYYTVALAPAIAALVATGATIAWRQRHRTAARIVLAATFFSTSLWSFVLLNRSLDFLPWLRWLVLISGVVGEALLLALPWLARRIALVLAATAIIIGLAGPAAYAGATVATGHGGSIPSAGPRILSTGAGAPGGGPIPVGAAAGMPGGPPNGGPPPGGPPPGEAMNGPSTDTRRVSGPGLVAVLTEDAQDYTWIAATVGGKNAAGVQLSTGRAVMAIGGFNGTDNSPTLARFQEMVAAGEIHYYLGGSAPRSSSGSSAARDIATWVAETFPARSVDGTVVYDLTAANGDLS